MIEKTTKSFLQLLSCDVIYLYTKKPADQRKECWVEERNFNLNQRENGDIAWWVDGDQYLLEDKFYLKCSFCEPWKIVIEAFKF